MQCYSSESQKCHWWMSNLLSYYNEWEVTWSISDNIAWSRCFLSASMISSFVILFHHNPVAPLMVNNHTLSIISCSFVLSWSLLSDKLGCAPLNARSAQSLWCLISTSSCIEHNDNKLSACRDTTVDRISIFSSSKALKYTAAAHVAWRCHWKILYWARQLKLLVDNYAIGCGFQMYFCSIVCIISL